MTPEVASNHRRSRVLLVVGAVAAAAVTTGLLARRSAAAAPTGAQVAAVLSARTAALRDHDAAAFAALLASGSDTADQREFADLARLPLSGVGYAATGAPAGRTVTVAFSYRYAGFDTATRTATEVDTFARRGGRWLIADVRHRTPVLWGSGSVAVATGAGSLVITSASAALGREVSAEVDRDIPLVTASWGADWSRRVVVLVPGSAGEVGALTGESGDLGQVAAAVVGATLIVNTPAYAKLSATGRRVTVTHELTHVASRTSTTASSPTWLVEGLADEIGFAGSGLSTAAIAAELAAAVRAGRVPTALPADAAYAPTAPDLAATYEQGWLASRLLAERLGTAGLVAFYRQVGASGLSPARAVAAALMRDLHESTAAFTRQWITTVRALR